MLKYIKQAARNTQEQPMMFLLGGILCTFRENWLEISPRSGFAFVSSNHAPSWHDVTVIGCDALWSFIELSAWGNLFHDALEMSSYWKYRFHQVPLTSLVIIVASNFITQFKRLFTSGRAKWSPPRIIESVSRRSEDIVVQIEFNQFDKLSLHRRRFTLIRLRAPSRTRSDCNEKATTIKRLMSHLGP